MNCLENPQENYADKYLYQARYLSFYLCLVVTILVLSSDQLQANPDVYATLPDDTRVVQYGMGDLDGDLMEELAVLYTSGGTASLALFKADSGHWTLWWKGNELLSGMEGTSPSSIELVDVNDDRLDEILFYYLTGGGRGMASRILTLGTDESGNVTLDVLLEDTTVPPGYPLFGVEEGAPSVTFLRMPLIKGETGHRRVYCWDGNRFEKCVEVPWIKP